MSSWIGRFSVVVRVVWDRQDSPRLLVASDITPKDELAELIDEASQLIAILTSIIKETKVNALLFHTSQLTLPTCGVIGFSCQY